MRLTAILIASTAVAATAVSAPVALAATEPLSHNQVPRLIAAQEVHAANDVACPAVTPSPPPVPSPLATTGGCRFHFAGDDVKTIVHLPIGAEATVADCDYEFDMRIDAAGEGYISHQELTNGAMPCTAKACGQQAPPTSEGRAWSFFMRESEPAPREAATILFCIETLDTAEVLHCEVTIPLSQPAVHRYRLSAVDIPGHGAIVPDCEFTGTLDVEAAPGTTGEGQAEQNVEIRHT